MRNAPVARQQLRGWIDGPATVVGSLEKVRVENREILPVGAADADPGDCHWRTAVVRQGDGPGDAAVNRVGGKNRAVGRKDTRPGGLLGPPCARLITATAAPASTTAIATPMAAALGTNRAAFRGVSCSFESLLFLSVPFARARQPPLRPGHLRLLVAGPGVAFRSAQPGGGAHLVGKARACVCPGADSTRRREVRARYA